MKHQDKPKTIMLRLFQSMLVPVIIMGMSALGMQACGWGHDDTGRIPSCIPNSAQVCICRGGGGPGIQTCQANGEFERCPCSISSSSSSSSSGSDCHAMAGAGPDCGNGIYEFGEECDDGNCDPTDECNNNCKLPYCGDHVVQPPEICDGEEFCPPDCGLQTTSSSSSTSSGCNQKFIFAGFAQPQSGAFSYQGQFGIDAATAACKDLGGFGMCEYVDWKALEANQNLYPVDIDTLTAAIPIGTCMSVWLQRSTDLPNCPKGPGANCNNWNYPYDILADGEYVTICNNNGTFDFSYALDCDPTYDPVDPLPHNAPGLECSIARAIPCCYKSCTPFP